MLEWKDDEDLQTLFDRCEMDCGSKEYAVLIISDFKQDVELPNFNRETVYDVICNFYPNDEYRQRTDNIKLFSLDPEVRFKSADRAVVAYPIEYIMTTMNQGQTPYKYIYIVTSLGEARDIVRKQISKKRAKKIRELGAVRDLLLRGFDLRTVKMSETHPYRITSMKLFNEKRGIIKKRQEVAEEFTTEIEVGGISDE